MKLALFVLFSLSSIQAQARGVLLRCWAYGEAQTEENVIYQDNGGYIYSSFVITTNDVKYEFDAAVGNCLDWDFDSVCEDKVAPTIGDVGLKLEREKKFQSGGDLMFGVLYAVDEVPVYCTRIPQ